MKDQIEEAFNIFDGTLRESVTSPTNKHLFVTYKYKSEQLEEETRKIYHSVTEKLLFIMNRARLDIETTVSFLMARVSKSNKHYWEKLK